MRDFPHFNILISIPTKARPDRKITAHVYTDKKENPGEVIALAVGGRTSKKRENCDRCLSCGWVPYGRRLQGGKGYMMGYFGWRIFLVLVSFCFRFYSTLSISDDLVDAGTSYAQQPKMEK